MNMKDEIVKEGMSTVKKTIIGVITTIVTAVGAYVTTHIEELFGGGDEDSTPTEVVVPVENNNNQQQNVNVEGPTINLTIPQAAPTQTIIRETVREVPATQPVVQPEPMEEKPETNTERMARLKKMKEERGGN